MRISVLVGLVMSGLLCGCASFRLGEGLEIGLVNARLDQPTVFETTAHFTVRISNQTPEPIALDGSVHRIYLNGVYVGEGLSSERLDVPRLDSATQEVTVHLSNSAVATRLRSMIQSRAVDYRIKSTLYLSGDHHSRRCRIERDGRTALDDFQPHPTAGANY